MSRSEIAKHAGWVGAASGAVLTRRKSQARNLSRSSRSAAFRPAWKNRSRCCGSSRAHPFIRTDRCGASRVLFKSGSSKGNTKNEKRKYAEVPGSRGPRVFLCDQRDPKNQGVISGLPVPRGSKLKDTNLLILTAATRLKWPFFAC